LTQKTTYAALLIWLTPAILLAQDPFQVAGDHYHLVFENQWVRATRVTYGPHDTAPVHAHPPNPVTVYVYVTDGGVMQFTHMTGFRIPGVVINRPAVKAGAIRVAHGQPETHSVKYLGDEPTEYARIELRTDPLDVPTRDVRLPPYVFDRPSGMAKQFENGQLRIVRVRCAAGEKCPASEHPDDPAVVVVLSGTRRGEILWNPAPLVGPLELVRMELTSEPVEGK
jgi:quercetin dioxygenase-like cupin family protein